MSSKLSNLKDLADKLAQVKESEIDEEAYNAFDIDLWKFDGQEPWYASVFAQMARRLTTSIPTAAVGYLRGELTFFANPNWLFKQPTLGRYAVYCHEIEHVIRQHIELMHEWPVKTKRLNFVMDALINESLIALPTFNKNSLWEDAVTYSVFKDVCSHKKEGICWDNNVQVNKFTTDATPETLLQYLPDDGVCDQMMQEFYGDIGELFDDSSVPDDVKKAMLNQILEEAEKSRGLVPSHLKRSIEKIKDKTNRNWRVLARGIGNSNKTKVIPTWSRVNKHVPWLYPGKHILRLPTVMVMVDTSGSIGQVEMRSFYRELNGLAKRCDMDVAFVDACFDKNNKEQFIRNAKKIYEHEPYGGGGTVFKEWYDYMLGEAKGKYESVLILTDGYADHIPARLARNQVLLLTPNHEQGFAARAAELGFKIAVVEDNTRL